MGLRLDILNINFRGARKTLNKTPRGRFLTPRKFARVPTTPAATNHVGGLKGNVQRAGSQLSS